MNRKPYPSDVSDEEWEFVMPYLCLLSVEARQRKHDLREVFNALRYLNRSGCSWRMLPHDLPPWEIVYQQTQHWLEAGVSETLAHSCARFCVNWVGASLIRVRRLWTRAPCTRRVRAEGAGYHGAKKKSGSKIHIALKRSAWAVDTLGHLTWGTYWR